MGYNKRCPTCGGQVLHCDQCGRQIVRDEPCVRLDRESSLADPTYEWESPDLCSVACLQGWIAAHPNLLTMPVAESWKENPFHRVENVGWYPILSRGAEAYAKTLTERHGIDAALAEQIALDASDKGMG